VLRLADAMLTNLGQGRVARRHTSPTIRPITLTKFARPVWVKVIKWLRRIRSQHASVACAALHSAKDYRFASCAAGRIGVVGAAVP
jgi:hypothetical protein